MELNNINDKDVIQFKEFNKYHVLKIKQLLHKEYRDSKVILCNTGIKAFFQGTYEFVRYKLKLKSYLELINLVFIKRKVNGVYCDDSKTAVIYLFNIRKMAREYKSEDLIGLFASLTLIHELRHHYQNKVDMKESIREKDAIKFEYRMFDKFYNEIKEILKD